MQRLRHSVRATPTVSPRASVLLFKRGLAKVSGNFPANEISTRVFELLSKKTDRSPDVNPHNFRYKRGWFCEWCETVYRKREEDDSLRSQQNLPDDLFWVGCESCDRWCHLRCERANDPDGLIFGNAVPMTHAPESMDFVAIPERLKFHCAKCRDDQERTERDPKWTTASNSLAAGAEVRHGVLAHFRPFLRVDSSVDVTGITGVNTSVTGAATGSVSRRRSLPRTRCISEIAPTRCKSGKGTRKRETFALDPGKKDAAGLNDTASTIVTVAKEVDPSLFNDGPPAKKRKPSKSRSKSKSSSKAGESASSDTVTATVDKTLAASVAELVSPTPRRPRSRSTRATATALRAKKEPAVTPKVSQPVVPQIDSLAFPSPVAGIASLPKSPLEMLKAQAGQVETRLQETKRFGKPQAPASPVLPSTISPPARGGMGSPTGLRFLRQPAAPAVAPLVAGLRTLTALCTTRDTSADGSVIAKLLASSLTSKLGTKASLSTKTTLATKTTLPPAPQKTCEMKYVTFAPSVRQTRDNPNAVTVGNVGVPLPRLRKSKHDARRETPLGTDFQVGKKSGVEKKHVPARYYDEARVLLDGKDADPWGLGVRKDIAWFET